MTTLNINLSDTLNHKIYSANEKKTCSWLTRKNSNVGRSVSIGTQNILLLAQRRQMRLKPLKNGDKSWVRMGPGYGLVELV